jgi:mono/diheme cytochrome c family protein
MKHDYLRTLIRTFVIAWTVIAPLCNSRLLADEAALEIEFNRDIRTILSENCFACHGPDAGTREAGLRFDIEAAAKAELESGERAIVPGNVAASSLLARVTSEDESLRMPPLETKKQLSPKQVELLKQWIKAGAKWQGHWAYEPVKRPAVADIDERDAPLGAADTFVMARLRREKLESAAEADRTTLIRRFSFDLVGLPPMPDEVDAFVADESPDAIERVIDRLLAAPQYGERMAVSWLDLVRYGDSCGYHSDNDQPISPYRDYVIAAFNANMPFDQFTREQLAGDLLENPTLAQRVATGFNRLNKTTEEGGAQAAEYIEKYAADRVRTTAGVWLGQTLGCAECHDHKYDPITAKDFYSFAAFFADVQERGVYGNGRREPEIPVPTAREQQKLDEYAAKIADFNARLAAEGVDAEAAADLKKRREKLVAARAKFEKSLTRTMVTVAAKPREMRILPRGNWLDKTGPVVESAFPESFPRFASLGEPKQGRLTRLDLANWIVAPENPLASRVLVNRLWKQFFGIGLSKQLDDFGVQGEWPSHPKLLDYLAAEMLESGWDVKHVVRKLASSATYRRSSVPTAEMASRDPQNRLFARQGRWRLEAEVIRDNALFAAGMLSLKIGGPSVKPYQPAEYWKHLNFPKRTWTADVGENQYRRGLYAHWQRTFLHPSMLALDATAREECTAERPVSNTPKSALVLLNDPTFVEAARVLAARVLREGGATTEEKIRFVWRVAVSREPADGESYVIEKLYREHIAHFDANPEAANSLLTEGMMPAPADRSATEVAAWTSVARAVLNLQEATTRN